MATRTWKQTALAGLSRSLRGRGLEIRRRVVDVPGPYRENPEVGARNLSEKQARLERGEAFEWPGMVALNRAIVPLVPPAQRVVNVGAGTGSFEWHAAEAHPHVEFVASELDRDCVAWCNENRARANVRYTDLDLEALLQEEASFDLAVCVDVIEHVADFGGFLRAFSRLADRAIVTTPNKARHHRALTAMPPRYEQHVREWTAGEFFWVLRSVYDEVEIYAHATDDPPTLDAVGPLSSRTPLVAVCRRR